MPTEYDDAQHFGIFTTSPALTNSTGRHVRQSELTLAALRAAGVLDTMVDSLSAPPTDRLWLDKNTDPAVLKTYDSTGLAWVPVTFDRLFNRGVNKLRVIPLTKASSSANLITVVEPAEFFDGLLYSVVPSANNTDNAFITVQGVGTYPVTYANSQFASANELIAGEPKVLMFLNSQFVVLLPTAPLYAAMSETLAASALALNTVAQAENLLDAAQAAYVGFEPGTFYDLGRVTDPIQLFPSDLGRVTAA